MIRQKKGYADGWRDGRKSLTESIIGQLDAMENAYMENVVKWEDDEDGYDENALDARAVISDLRKILRMLT